MAYQKQTWNNGDIITKEKMDHIEEGIFNIELTTGPQGPAGPQGATGPKGDKGETGAKGKDAVITKLDNIAALETGSVSAEQIATAYNALIADLKAKGYMNQS